MNLTPDWIEEEAEERGGEEDHVCSGIGGIGCQREVSACSKIYYRWYESRPMPLFGNRARRLNRPFHALPGRRPLAPGAPVPSVPTRVSCIAY
jgi:hypothetical protein